MSFLYFDAKVICDKCMDDPGGGDDGMIPGWPIMRMWARCPPGDDYQTPEPHCCVHSVKDGGILENPQGR